MVMADFFDRDRGRRRFRRGFGRRGGDRDYRGYYGDREKDEDEDEYSHRYPMKILSKPFLDKNHPNDVQRNHVRDSSKQQYSRYETPSKPVVMLKSNGEARSSKPGNNSHDAGQNSIPNLLANDNMPAHVYKDKKSQQQLGSSLPSPDVKEGGSRLAAPPEMTKSIKLIDENMTWCEGAANFLLDQTDYLTVGVLGLQGVGKSTLLCLLAGNRMKDSSKSMVFKPQGRDARDVCSHQTMGVDLFVTGERTILLDSQPLLSASILDLMIHKENKFSVDYNTAENWIEMQSLQVTSLLMTVCNVVVVVIDWFIDMNVLRLLETAEMLRPTTPSGGSGAGGTGGQDAAHIDYHPHIVFVLNGASGDDFDLSQYDVMQTTLAKVFEKSNLTLTGGINMTATGLMARRRGRKADSEVNLFLLPKMENDVKKEETPKSARDAAFTLMNEYRGHHSYRHSVEKLRHSLLAMPRRLLTRSMLSEKNWFHYAARSWDAIKKSVMFSEYNRLLP